MSQEKINHPSHYKNLFRYKRFEVIDIKRYLASDLADAVKYVCRAGLKESESAFDDLEKAKWYLNDYMMSCSGFTPSKTAISVFHLIDRNCIEGEIGLSKYIIVKYIVYNLPGKAIDEISRIQEKFKKKEVDIE